MISFTICEDEPYFLDSIKELLNQYSNLKNIEISVNEFSNGEDFLSSGQNADIILMDIELPGMDGMKVVEQLRNKGNCAQVIFITAYRKYVFQAFDVEAIYYILKPIDPNKFFVAINKAIERMVCRYDNALMITNGNTSLKILTKNIRFCEVFNHEVIIHTKTQKYNYSGTLDSLEKLLDDFFYRCHRSYIVNMNYVTARVSDIAYIEGGDKVLISRRKQLKFGEKLLAICRKETGI